MSASHQPQTQIRPAQAGDWQAVQAILLEYATTLEPSLVQDAFALAFEAEIASLPGDYAAPRGVVILAWVDDLLAGCCALRPLDDSDHMGAAEMRRLFVRPAFRGLGLGKSLTEGILDYARQQGYDCVLLDTLDSVEVARQLYSDLGFYEIEPFYNSPLPGSHYLKREL